MNLTVFIDNLLIDNDCKNARSFVENSRLVAGKVGRKDVLVRNSF